jgi:hypothetical protein
VLSFWFFAFGHFATALKPLLALTSIFSRLIGLALDEAEIKQNATAPPSGISLSESHSAIYKAFYQQHHGGYLATRYIFPPRVGRVCPPAPRFS